jgi:hypothetical protein
MGKTSCAFSKGITLPSSLIRTHAPSLYPPCDFRLRPYSKGLCRLPASPCCVKALPNAIAVVLPYVPGPLLQLLPRCCLPFLPLGHWPSPSEHGSALGFFPSLLLRMVKILELQSFLYVPAHRFVRLTGSSYPHTSQCRAAETFTAAHITVGYLPRAAAMLTIQTGQLMVRGLAPLRSDRLVGYSDRYSFIMVDLHHLLLAGLPGALEQRN